MKYIEPLPFTLEASNIPNDYSLAPDLWDSTVSYNVGDYAYVIVQKFESFGSFISFPTGILYKTYKAVAANTGVKPTEDDGTNWQLVNTSEEKPDTAFVFGYFKWIEAAWSAGQTVAVVETYKGNAPTYGIYRAAVDAASTDWPPTTPEKWQYLGVVHKYRPFDSAINTVAQYPDEITYTISSSSTITSIAFFGVYASSITIVQKDSSGTIVYEKTYQLTMDFSDWFGYFFEELERYNSLYVEDLLMYRESTIEITISAPGEVAMVGAIVPGRPMDVGVTLYDSGVSSLDLSEKEENYGFATLQDKGFVRSTSLLALVDNRALSLVMRKLFKLRNRLIAFIGDERDEGYELFRSYGFLRRASALVSNPVQTTISLEIEETI